jgi:hypothetical protein
MDSMAQYSTMGNAQAGSHSGQPGTGQVIGRGNYAGTIALTQIPPSTSLTDDQIQQTIETAINGGNLPQPDANTYYAIYFPRQYKISIDGLQSCVMFGAYHMFTPPTQHHAFYGVMPDCGYGFTGVTSVSSHELGEATSDADPTAGTNPDFPQAWNDSQGNEIGDLCVSSGGSISTPKGSFNVQGLWDESAHGCKVAHAAATDMSVSVDTSASTSLSSGAAAQSVTFHTTGTGQLTLNVLAPTGVHATLSATTVNAGDAVNVTLTADAGTKIKDGQIVVQATGTGGQVRSAALLLQVSPQ